MKVRSWRTGDCPHFSSFARKSSKYLSVLTICNSSLPCFQSDFEPNHPTEATPQIARSHSQLCSISFSYPLSSLVQFLHWLPEHNTPMIFLLPLFLLSQFLLYPSSFKEDMSQCSALCLLSLSVDIQSLSDFPHSGGFKYHLYANDSQISSPFPSNLHM